MLTALFAFGIIVCVIFLCRNSIEWKRASWGLSLFIFSVAFFFSSSTKIFYILDVYVNVPNAIKCEKENIIVHEKRAETFNEIMTTELIQYPEYENGIFDKIDSKIILKYPELKANTIFIEAYTNILKYKDMLYESQIKINQLIAKREMRRGYILWL